MTASDSFCPYCGVAVQATGGGTTAPAWPAAEASPPSGAPPFPAWPEQAPQQWGPSPDTAGSGWGTTDPAPPPPAPAPGHPYTAPGYVLGSGYAPGSTPPGAYGATAPSPPSPYGPGSPSSPGGPPAWGPGPGVPDPPKGRSNRVLAAVSAAVVIVAVVVIVVVLASSGGGSKHPTAANASTSSAATTSGSTATTSPPTTATTSTSTTTPSTTTPASTTTAGGATSPYPSNVQTSYLKSCEGGSAGAAYCQCTLQYFEDHVPYSTFVADVEKDGTPPDLTQAVTACESQYGSS